MSTADHRTLDQLKERCNRDPGSAQAFAELGNALAQHQSYNEAAQAFARATELAPGRVDLLRLLGWAHQFRGDFVTAAAVFGSAVQVSPRDVGSLVGLSGALRSGEHYAESLVHAREAVRLQPGNGLALFTLARAAAPLGEAELAEQSLLEAARVGYGAMSTLSARLLLLHNRHGDDGDRMFAEHRAWAARFTDDIPPIGHVTRPPRERQKLRIGYLSADFRTHAVSNFFEPVLAAHDLDRVEPVLYHNSPYEDAVTRRLQAMATSFVPVRQLQDEALERRIKDDGIDVLVDLAGHTAGARPLVIARKPAPIIVNYIGYPNTLGMRQVDFRATDDWHVPPGGEKWHAESLLRVGGGAWAWRPYDDAPEVTPSPAVKNGYVTFISSNAWAKVTDQMLTLWREILLAAPTARMILVTADVAYCRPRVDRAFEGVDPARVRLVGRLPIADYLSLYGEADVMLDTFPFAGHTTTCDALWQGCPVVTLAGRTHISRAGVSVLNAVGMGEWVAADARRYVEQAVSAASNLSTLAISRGQIRQRVQASPLRNARRVAKALEEAGPARP